MNTMMWRTTHAFGLFGFGAMLAYLAFLLGSDAGHGMGLRVIVAGPLLLAGCTCLVAAFRSRRRQR
jgi:hypothetical protein